VDIVHGEHAAAASQTDLEDAGTPDLFAIQLALGLWPAVDQHPGRLQGVCVADQGGRLSRVPCRHSLHHVDDATAQPLDRLVTREQTAARLVHYPERPANRDLPVGDALQVAAELGLTKLWLGNQPHRRGQRLTQPPRPLTATPPRPANDALDPALAAPSA